MAGTCFGASSSAPAGTAPSAAWMILRRARVPATGSPATRSVSSSVTDSRRRLGHTCSARARMSSGATRRYASQSSNGTFAHAAANDGAKTVVALTRMAKLLQDYPYTVNNVEVDLEKDPLFDKVRGEKGFAEVVRAVSALRK